MNYSALIQNRKSVRAFTEKYVPFETMDQIKVYHARSARRLLPEIDTVLRVFGLDAKAALEGAAGYEKFLIGSPQYLVLLSEQHPLAAENAGYIMEDLLLKLSDMGLDSCWLTFHDSERIKVAREFGDISENSEYDDAKNEQGMMEARIAEISRILSEATVVTTPKRSSKVNIGSTVTVDMGGRERVFTIVGGAESDVASGKISNESPVGSALLGRKKGDKVETTGPTGKHIEMTILKIEH